MVSLVNFNTKHFTSTFTSMSLKSLWERYYKIKEKCKLHKNKKLKT